MAEEHQQPRNPVRLVTASSLFDGHDASINIMRRILQSQGCEVIHLGHNRSVQEVVDAALEEDAQGVAVSSYQAATWSTSNTSCSPCASAAPTTSASSAGAAG